MRFRQQAGLESGDGWDLAGSVPGARVIVTSRPAAADDRWLTAEGFSSVMLEPMTPAHLRKLVKRVACRRPARGEPAMRGGRTAPV